MPQDGSILHTSYDLVKHFLNIKWAQVLHTFFCVSMPYCKESQYKTRQRITHLSTFAGVCFRGRWVVRRHNNWSPRPGNCQHQPAIRGIKKRKTLSDPPVCAGIEDLCHPRSQKHVTEVILRTSLGCNQKHHTTLPA
jgi:hypothetical protein